MLLDLIDKLIDRCIQLIERREKVDRELYSDFLTPALEDFENVHKNYIKTFTAYRKHLKSSLGSMNKHHPIFDRITEDSLLSASVRSKVLALRSFEGDQLFGRFIHRMCGYILGTGNALRVMVEGSPLYYNAPRQMYYSGLKEIFGKSISEKEKKIKALELVNFILKDLQNGYQLVMDEHVRLKALLLGLKPPEKPLSRLDGLNLRHEEKVLKLKQQDKVQESEK